jgi:hypothetical protein
MHARRAVDPPVRNTPNRQRKRGEEETNTQTQRQAEAHVQNTEMQVETHRRGNLDAVIKSAVGSSHPPSKELQQRTQADCVNQCRSILNFSDSFTAERALLETHLWRALQ